MTRLVPLIAALAALSACSGNQEADEPVGAVSESEAAALDDAAEMIEARRLPEGAVPEDGDGEQTPADTSRLPAPQESGGPERMELPQ
ncbi:hypothetical protein [Qipengyuania sp.]|uniref:hypothetical protein n=1 Tax=Qipengyuania sp. TaxID=2004515 RepID=UPI003AF84812